MRPLRSRLQELHRRVLYRDNAVVQIALTAREARATARAIDLVIEILRPHLFDDDRERGFRQVTPPPLVTVRQVLAHACERANIDMDDPWLARAYENEAQP